MFNWWRNIFRKDRTIHVKLEISGPVTVYLHDQKEKPEPKKDRHEEGSGPWDSSGGVPLDRDDGECLPDADLFKLDLPTVGNFGKDVEIEDGPNTGTEAEGH